MGLKTDKPLYHHRRIEKGLTILEVLLSIFLSCLVGLVLYQMFYTQDRTYAVQSEASEMQQNLRVAMERISRDLTMAGFAQPPWTTINGEGGIDFEAVRVTGGSVLDVIGSFDGPQGRLSKRTVLGATVLELSSGDGDNFRGQAKVDISVGGRENVRITNKNGNILTVDADPYTAGLQGLAYEYPAGAPVYLVKWKTYRVDNSKPEEPILRVDDHVGSGAQPLALYITAIKLVLAGKTAQITITGRTRNPDRSTGLHTVGQLHNTILLRNVP